MPVVLGGGVGPGQWGIIASTLVLVCHMALSLGVSFGSWCRCWLRMFLMCFHLMQLSCLAAGDVALLEGHLEKASTIQQSWWGRLVIHACGGVARDVVCVGGPQ